MVKSGPNCTIINWTTGGFKYTTNQGANILPNWSKRILITHRCNLQHGIFLLCLTLTQYTAQHVTPNKKRSKIVYIQMSCVYEIIFPLTTIMLERSIISGLSYTNSASWFLNQLVKCTHSKRNVCHLHIIEIKPHRQHSMYTTYQLLINSNFNNDYVNQFII